MTAMGQTSRATSTMDEQEETDTDTEPTDANTDIEGSLQAPSRPGRSGHTEGIPARARTGDWGEDRGR
jgi:hypothetical protein